MKASLETLALIRSADDSANAAAKSGVKAVVALIRENIAEKFKHGDAVELATLLKDGKVAVHSAKRYADLTVIAIKAINHQASLAASKAKPAEKQAAKDSSIKTSLETLASFASMAKVRQWSKDNGPKGEKTATAQAVEPTAQAIESVGQLREIRECLAMVNTGQITQTEALNTIGEIVGLAIAKPVKPTAKPTAKPVKTGT